jgi:hypothetical protein
LNAVLAGTRSLDEISSQTSSASERALEVVHNVAVVSALDKARCGVTALGTRKVDGKSGSSLVAVNGHFIGVGVNNGELLLGLSSVVEVDTNTTRNDVVVISLEDISRIVAAVGTESIVVARLNLAAERDLIQSQVTVNSVATQVTALTPERVSQVNGGLRTKRRNRELAASNAVSVSGIGSGSATARQARSNVAASRECVAFTTSAASARESVETSLASVTSDEIASNVLLRTERASSVCARHFKTRFRCSYTIRALAVSVLDPDLASLIILAWRVFPVVIVGCARISARIASGIASARASILAQRNALVSGVRGAVDIDVPNSSLIVVVAQRVVLSIAPLQEVRTSG